ncbi:hypothetical protein D3C78_1592600 [compost metagenome]
MFFICRGLGRSVGERADGQRAHAAAASCHSTRASKPHRLRSFAGSSHRLVAAAVAGVPGSEQGRAFVPID